MSRLENARLENYLFSMSKLENEAATPSFSRALLENEAGGKFLNLEKILYSRPHGYARLLPFCNGGSAHYQLAAHGERGGMRLNCCSEGMPIALLIRLLVV